VQRVQGALRSCQFTAEQWVDPLQHMAAAEGEIFKTVLEGELARVIKDCARPDAAWRTMAREHTRKKDKKELNFINEQGHKGGVTASAEASEEPVPSVEDPEHLEQVHRDVAVRSRASFDTSDVRTWEDEEDPVEDSTAPREHTAPHEYYSTARKGKKRPPYVLVIPSYGRPERLQTNTLALLRHQVIW
jgi:hypothetical protein